MHSHLCFVCHISHFWKERRGCFLANVPNGLLLCCGLPPVFLIYRYGTGIWCFFDLFWSGMVCGMVKWYTKFWLFAGSCSQRVQHFGQKWVKHDGSYLDNVDVPQQKLAISEHGAPPQAEIRKVLLVEHPSQWAMAYSAIFGDFRRFLTIKKVPQ